MALVATGVSAGLVARHGGAGAPAQTAPSPYREAVVAPQRPLILDPLLARSDPASRDLSALLNCALLRLNSRVVPVPDLASTWGVSGDGLTYRFQLTPGRLWSDGSPITPADAVATVALVQRLDFPDRTLASTWKNVTVAPTGDGTITMTLPSPRASFAVAVADLPILPASIATLSTPQLVATAHQAMPASGPLLVRSSDQRKVELIPNLHAALRPRLTGVELRLEPDFMSAARDLATGQADGVLATNPAQRAALATLKGTRLHDQVTLRFVDLLLNTRTPGLGDPVVRRALAAAVDRRALINTALDGQGRAQMDAIPAGIDWLGSGGGEQPNPVLASRALDAAGYVADLRTGMRARGAIRLDFTLAVPDAPPLPAVARELARQMAAIGVSATVVIVPADRFPGTVVLSAGYQMAIADWDNGADPDVSAFWRSNATPPGGFNVSGLSPDPFLDHALDSLATQLDPQLRAEAAQQVDQRLAEAVPAVFLYAPMVSFAVTDAIAGVVVPDAGTPAARYSGIAAWWRSP
ncbi:MAG TPA: ABC transporter substrate-binding protein [Candidatus Dormibacteraeota bacterium]